MLEQIPEAVVSEAAPEPPTKENQTSALPSSTPTQTSPSNDSDLDDIPIGQRMKKLHKPSHKPQQTIPQLPLQEEQTSAAAEGSEDTEEPIISDLPTCDSPLNLHSLEKHEGEKNHKKGGLNCVFGNFFFYVLDNCPQVQSLK